jgi:flagellar basal-body rod modification protein FlgD
VNRGINMTTPPVTNNSMPWATNSVNPDGKNLGQRDFLRLMVAQAQHQDPLQPQANGEFLSQLAQFSTNDGITKMQESLQQLAFSMQSGETLQASTLVGRNVMVSSDKLALSPDSENKVTIDMVPGASELVASVYSETGELIKTMPLGQPPVGPFSFKWDGTNNKLEPMPQGNYTVKVACKYQGREEALSTMTSAKVESIRVGRVGEGVQLNLAGIGEVALRNVRQISV